MRLKIGIISTGLVLGYLVFADTVVEEESGTISAATTVKSPEDLRTLLRAEQEKYALLAPPTTELYWSERNDDIFVDWTGWPESAKELAFAILDENLIPRYEIHLWEDPETGIITMANMYKAVMAELQPEEGFDPLGWVM
ncbi:MAG: hypothetical protein DRP64_20635, partial [Verrucomicrobia bacterium]